MKLCKLCWFFISCCIIVSIITVLSIMLNYRVLKKNEKLIFETQELIIDRMEYRAKNLQ